MTWGNVETCALHLAFILRTCCCWLFVTVLRFAAIGDGLWDPTIPHQGSSKSRFLVYSPKGPR